MPKRVRWRSNAFFCSYLDSEILRQTLSKEGGTEKDSVRLQNAASIGKEDVCRHCGHQQNERLCTKREECAEKSCREVVKTSNPDTDMCTHIDNGAVGVAGKDNLIQKHVDQERGCREEKGCCSPVGQENLTLK